MTAVISVVSNDIATDNRVHKICSSLVSNGYKVIVAGRRLSDSLPMEGRPYLTRRFRLLFNNGPLFYMNLNLRIFFYLIFTHTDIILANDLDTLLGCTIAARIKRVKLIFDSHELFPEVPELVDRPVVRKIWLFLEKRLLPRIDAGITVSKSIAEFYLEKYSTEFTVVRNAAVFHADNKKSKRNNIAGQVTILYQGALNIGRGIRLAVQSMEYVDGAVLIIIGSGDIEQELHKLVHDLGSEKKIKFTGKVPMEKLWEYTRKAHIGISLEEDLGLNYRYALPNKLFDYIQARIPVIVSDLPEMKGVVEKYKIGRILKERTPEALASVINKMIVEELPSGKYLSDLELAARELSWQREEEILIQLFRNLK